MGSESGYTIGRDKAGLTKRDREVIAALTRPRTLAEAGERLGMSRQRVSEIALRLVERGVLVKVGRGFALPPGAPDEKADDEPTNT